MSTRNERFNKGMKSLDAMCEGKEHLIDVLRLIVKYNGDREQILEEVPRRTYFRQRKKLCKFFCGTPWC